MTNKLFVTNLPADATEESLRAHFSTCGGVADVEIVADRKQGVAKRIAHVTMTSSTFASRAISELDGATFGGCALRVSDKKESNENAPPGVRIAQQFRERNNMTYDLDCSGTPLTLRIFPAGENIWRIEARIADHQGAIAVSATGPIRIDVLRAVLRQWNEAALASHVPQVDAEAVTKAMYDVRAV
jgi:RNA recognition motif-containing protein